MSAGTVWVELDLDYTKFERNQQKLIQSATASSLSIEKNFQNLGVKSDKIYDAMRISATNSLEMIKAKSVSSGNEIARAQASHAATMKRINDEQYGHQASAIDFVRKNYLAMIGTATAAFYTISKVTSAYIEEEAAVLRLGVAMKNQGDYTREGLQAFRDYASEIQKTTAVGDENVLAVMGNLKSYGMLDSEVKKATQTVLDFAEGAKIEGMTVETAGQLIGKAYAGNTATLSRYGIVIDSTLTGAAKFDAVLKQLNERFGGSAQAQLASYGGQWANLKNQIGDLSEYVGLVALKAIQALSAAGAGLAFPLLWSIEKMMRGLTWLTDKVSYVAGKLGFEGLEASIAKVSETMKSGADVMKGHADEANKFAIANMKAAVSGDAIGEMLDKMKSGKRTGKAGGAEADKTDPALERRLREVAKMYAEEGKLVHDALMAEAGMNQEYHDTIRKMDDEAWEEEKKIAAAILAMDAKRYAEEGAMMMDALAAEMGLTQEYLDTVRDMKQAEFDAWKEMHDPKAMAEFYDSIVGYEKEAHDRKVALIEAERDARIAAGIDAVAANKKAQQEIGALTANAFNKEISDRQQAFSSMKSNLSAMAELYEKDSRERRALSELSKAAAIAEMAVQAQKNIMIAVGAVAQQGTGEPYSAFARIAAMIAVMSSVLGMAGIAFGGGGSASASAPVLPASTALGAEAGTGSESISKVWELLEDTYDLESRELTGIHSSIKELNTNITGLVVSLVRTMGGTIGSTSGMSVMDQVLWGGTESRGTQSFTWPVGIDIGASRAGNLLAGGSVSSQQYAAPPSGTLYRPLPEQVEDLLTAVYKDMSRTLIDIAEGFSVDTTAALNYIFEATKLNLQGMTGEEIDTAVNEYLSGTLDKAVTALFGDMIGGYQKLNEGLFETAMRLIADRAVVMDILEMTNKAFVGTTAQAVAFSEALIEIAGDLDELQDAADTYYNKFFTDAEHTARTYEMLTGYFADMNSAFPSTRDGFRSMVEGLDLTTDAGREQYVMMLKLSGAADDYYSAMGDNLDMQNNLTTSLKKQSETIQGWLAGMNLSSLAPVTSLTSYMSEYDRQKAAAYAPGATEQDLSGFLNYAKEYLSFMRTYGGDYKAIYDAVTGDVAQLGDIKDAQIAAIETADMAARAAAADHTKLLGLVVQATAERDPARLPAIREEADTVRVIPESGEWYYQTYAAGGLTSGPSLAGEAGREWVVPTYEPQRSRFLESAPPQFWENLRGAGVVQSGGGDITVHSVVMLDGKVVGETVAKQIPRNANLSDAIRRVN